MARVHESCVTVTACSMFYDGYLVSLVDRVESKKVFPCIVDRGEGIPCLGIRECDDPESVPPGKERAFDDSLLWCEVELERCRICAVYPYPVSGIQAGCRVDPVEELDRGIVSPDRMACHIDR